MKTLGVEEARQFLRPYQPPDYIDWHLTRIVTCLSHLAAQLRPDQTSILDVGHSPFVGLLMQRAGLAVTGVVSPRDHEAPAFCSWPTPRFDFHEVPWPVADTSFDGVIAMEVIEHVTTTPLAFLREAFRVTRPGGFLYLATPNANAWSKLMRSFQGGSTFDSPPYGEQYQGRHDMSHVYEYGVWELKDVATKAGWVVKNTRTWDPYQSDPTGIRHRIARALVGASLAVTGFLREGALMFRDRGHQISMVLERPGGARP